MALGVAFYWIFYGIPVTILKAILGINVVREEDLFTWFLDLKALGIYDGMARPYTNQFEIPEAKEYYTRNIDTGFKAAYGLNPPFAQYANNPE